MQGDSEIVKIVWRNTGSVEKKTGIVIRRIQGVLEGQKECQKDTRSVGVIQGECWNYRVLEIYIECWKDTKSVGKIHRVLERYIECWKDTYSVGKIHRVLERYIE